ncbi:uncharacterized protein LOC133914111 [Phragmites australis]|uniref:uncharacterized protein LOC133914111 n=1 Tax=Phragmites australis TaxID=29695 RepID=UPI002D77D7FD|nr:uncharacterized protein LOC133914111 [Phragmites australis]
MRMEQVFRHCDRDTLKMAMLKHEETFRQQVHELHRLYSFQKLLMRDLTSQRNVSTSPNGGSTEHRRGTLGLCAYEHRYAARGRGGHVAATPTPRTALSLDVVAPAVGYVRSPEEADEETDDEAELELTLAVGGAGAGGGKKRYCECPSGGESFSSSSTESDVLPTGREWRQARGKPYHKRKSATGLDAVPVEDGIEVQPPPLLFHWLSLRMA